MAESRTSSEDQRSPSPLFPFDRMGATLSMIASLSVLVSFTYDWGFFYTLGIDFSEAPTSISDHVRSWLVWLPLVAAGALFVLSQELLIDRFVNRKVMGSTIVETSPQLGHSPKKRQIWTRFFNISFGPVLLALWLLFGDALYMTLWISFPVTWVLFSSWIFRHPTMLRRYSPSFTLSVTLVPAFFIFMFFLGGLNAYTRFSMPSASHTIVLRSATDSIQPEEIRLLRSFQDWLLVRDVNNKIAWIGLDDTVRVRRLEDNDQFRGFACAMSTKWCSITRETQ